ncbi:MAG: AraC family transcriptional regulator [Oscillospiraceae bacterium]|jgi:AraC-like DNA-binding protein|nr:AraC family transcriptional regulator [Oscillospiraceae bacterium]
MAVFNEEVYLYDQNSNSALFHLYAFGKLFPDPHYIIARKQNPDTIIECVLDGVGYIEANGFVTKVKKGDCYIIKPGTAHSYYADDAEPYTKIWVTVSGSLVGKWLELYEIDAVPFVRSFDMTSYFNQIKQLALGPATLEREKRLILLVHNILFEMGMTAPKASEPHKSSGQYIKTNENVILDVRKYIEKQCNEKLTMKELCNKFGISAKQLNTLFLQKYGISPSRYHMQCKIASAVYFLESTDMSIDMIAETIGFCDRSHFRKAFFQQHGTTPSQYRKQFAAKQRARY